MLKALVKEYTLILFFLLIFQSGSFAQSSGAALNDAIRQCNEAFQSGTPEEISASFPLTDQQEFIQSIRKSKINTKAGQSQIIKINKDSALVLLTGTLLYGNSGDETDYSGVYSGIYVFKPVAGKWKMTTKLSIDRNNQLKSHAISAAVEPAAGTIAVTDTLMIETRESYGFTLALNHHAKIKTLQLNHKDIAYVIDGGILWINSKVGTRQKLILSYVLHVDQIEKNQNSGYFSATYGHLRNQFYWHPFFSFSSTNDRAAFSVRISIPAAYHLASSLPQTDQVTGTERVITGKSTYPAFALSLYYDKAWQLHEYKKNDYKMEIYSGNDFKPLPDTLYTAFSDAFDLLSAKFGNPRGKYVSIVQDQSNPMNGWLNRSNDMIVAAKQGSGVIKNGQLPGAPFGHELAHAWTLPTGKATNFLTEGWASYAEGYFLEKKYGDTSFTRLLSNYRNIYFNNGYDTKVSLWDDISNGGVSYYKGVWVFYMLREQLGKDVFEKGLKAFMQTAGPMTIDLFIEKLSAAAGKDIHPVIDPWLKSKQVPHIKYSLHESVLAITQEGDIFNFPLDVQFTLHNGNKVRMNFNISSKEQSFKLADLKVADIASAVLDPDHKILMKAL